MTEFAPKVAASVGIIDRAETFGESDVTVSTTGTEQAAEAVSLLNGSQTTAGNIGYSNQYFGEDQDAGLRFVPNRDLQSVSASVDGNTLDWDTARILDASNGSIIAENTSPGNPWTINVNLTAGTEYVAVVANTQGDGQMDEVAQNSGNTPNATSPNLDLSGGWKAQSSNGDSYALNNVSGTNVPVTSGSVTVEWPDPTDIYAWDRATFQQTPNDGSVGVYVEESTDGGSSWTEVAGPISRGDSIPSDPSAEVRLRADLSRPSTDDTSPTLDAAYRRWVV